jgi:signal-transduction protein with cAMP-binding, CBS, and nucleotidyltransferase domain
MPLLSDILKGRNLLSAQTGETVAEVARRMASWNVGAVVVLEQGGALRGVFSERDLMKRVVVPRRDPETTRIDEVMSTDLTKAEEHTSVEEAMEMMRRCGCRHLPVMRDGSIVGFISMRDLMLQELAAKTDEIEHMRNYIQSV